MTLLRATGLSLLPHKRERQESNVSTSAYCFLLPYFTCSIFLLFQHEYVSANILKLLFFSLNIYTYIYKIIVKPHFKHLISETIPTNGCAKLLCQGISTWRPPEIRSEWIRKRAFTARLTHSSCKVYQLPHVQHSWEKRDFHYFPPQLKLKEERSFHQSWCQKTLSTALGKQWIRGDIFHCGQGILWQASSTSKGCLTCDHLRYSF